MLLDGFIPQNDCKVTFFYKVYDKIAFWNIWCLGYSYRQSNNRIADLALFHCCNSCTAVFISHTVPTYHNENTIYLNIAFHCEGSLSILQTIICHLWKIEPFWNHLWHVILRIHSMHQFETESKKKKEGTVCIYGIKSIKLEFVKDSEYSTFTLSKRTTD